MAHLHFNIILISQVELNALAQVLHVGLRKQSIVASRKVGCF